MGNETLTERERSALEHLKQAQQLGSTLSAYAQAFDVNVNELYNGRKQLQRKGAWPKSTDDAAASTVSAAEPELIAVQVVEPKAPPPTEALPCRLIAPSGWVVEFGAMPETRWLAMLFKAMERASS
jgi:hypothetical protein